MWPPSPKKTPDGVTIHLISGAGTPSELERREHCRVSSTVRQDLGLTWNSHLGNYGQIRVVRRASSGAAVDFTASFTVVGLNSDSGRTLSVHPNATGEAGGVKKLTGVDGTTSSLGVCQIWAVAPGHTSFTDAAGVTEEGDLLTEPLQGTEFSESARAAAHNRLALLVPHGGGIDRWTSDQRAAFEALFNDAQNGCSYVTDLNLWECQGQYRDSHLSVDMNTHDQWHVTSLAIEPRSFPALERLQKAHPLWMMGVLYQYALSLHGFDESSMKIVIGGQASDHDKEVVRDKILARVSNAVCCIVSADGTAHSGNPGGCTNLTSYRGIDDVNIVNRFSRNPNGVRYRGAIQIEQATQVRESHAAEVGKALAEAMCQLLGETPIIYLGDEYQVFEPVEFPRKEVTFQSPDLSVFTSPIDSEQLYDRMQALPSQSLVAGEAAWAYVRAYNANPGSPLSVYAHLYGSPPSTLVDPSRWQAIGVLELPEVAEEETPAVGELEWVASQDGPLGLTCLLHDQAVEPEELAQEALSWSLAELKAFLYHHRWAAWRNRQTVAFGESEGEGFFAFDVGVCGFHQGDHPFQLFAGAELPPKGQAAVILPAALYERLQDNRDPGLTVEEGKDGPDTVRIWLPSSGSWSLGEGELPAGLWEDCRVEVELPGGPEETPATVYLGQRHEGDDVGRFTWEITP